MLFFLLFLWSVQSTCMLRSSDMITFVTVCNSNAHVYEMLPNKKFNLTKTIFPSRVVAIEGKWMTRSWKNKVFVYYKLGQEWKEDYQLTVKENITDLNIENEMLTIFTPMVWMFDLQKTHFFKTVPFTQ